MLRFSTRFGSVAKLHVTEWGDMETINRACVDCGLITGSFCDYCEAVDHFPREPWAEGQLTPLCTHCDFKKGECHFCRGEAWCVPPPHHPDAQDEPSEKPLSPKADWVHKMILEDRSQRKRKAE